jgi:hypothetical protein
MTVFLLHADADLNAAEELRESLRQRGHVVEVDNGLRAFRPLQRGDVVVGLWSTQSLFHIYRMQIEKRLLDAWADSRLVLVKLDHGFLPVGLRDQPFIDASFVQSRPLQGWMQAERAVRDARERSLLELDDAPPTPAAPPPPQAAPGGGYWAGDGFGGSPDSHSHDAGATRSRSESMPMPSRAKRGGPAVLWHLVSILSVGVLAWALIAFNVPYALLIIIAAAVLTFLVPVLLFVARSKAPQPNTRTAATAATRSAPAAEAAPPPPSAPAPEAVASLFISYAHADREQVTPVVAIVEANGRKVWIDKGDIHAGDSWAGEIVRGIKSAKGVMVMCSKRAFESDHIKREVYLADRYKKPMLPVFLEEAPPPEDFEYFFASVQWLELFRLPAGEHEGAIGRALAAV